MYIYIYLYAYYIYICINIYIYTYISIHIYIQIYEEKNGMTRLCALQFNHVLKTISISFTSLSHYEPLWKISRLSLMIYMRLACACNLFDQNYFKGLRLENKTIVKI